MRRPSRTAATMVAKLSSSSTRLAASRATSVPMPPIATPISARASAGASFTPSPVIATISPRGLQRGDDADLLRRIDPGVHPNGARHAAPVRPRAALPARARSAPCRRHRACRSARAMARAVAGWSPVIITGVMPGLPADRYRGARFRPRRVQQPDQTQQGQVALQRCRRDGPAAVRPSAAPRSRARADRLPPSAPPPRAIAC